MVLDRYYVRLRIVHSQGSQHLNLLQHVLVSLTLRLPLRSGQDPLASCGVVEQGSPF